MINTELPETIESKIKNIIEKQLHDVIEEEFEKSKKELIERLDKHKDEILASVTLNIFKHISVMNFGEKIVIELKTEELKV